MVPERTDLAWRGERTGARVAQFLKALGATQAPRRRTGRSVHDRPDVHRISESAPTTRPTTVRRELSALRSMFTLGKRHGRGSTYRSYPRNSLKTLVPGAGLEPARGFPLRILRAEPGLSQ